jgi:1,4-alpha-glucan branching enzyme
LETPLHKGVQSLIQDLNMLYGEHEALWQTDSDASGFQWIEVDNAAENIVSFRRIAPATGREVICVCNFSPLTRENHRLGLARKGVYKQVLNTDHERYGGSGSGVVKGIEAEEIASHGFDYSAAITLPPLGTMWFAGEAVREASF